MLELPDGSKVEIFGPDSGINRHFTTGPVAGFLVDDSGNARVHFEPSRLGSTPPW